MNKLRVNEIYTVLEGEGILIGELHQFIRLQGCRVGCKTCDTKYAISEKGGTLMEYKDIIEKLNPSIKKVVITGGDPLLQKDSLVPFLKILIESLDLKTPSAGINLPENQFDILSKYIFNHPYVQIKAVISNEEDLEYAIDMFSLIHDKHPYTPLVFTPCWENDIPSKELINLIKERLMEEKMDYVRVILQQHKMVYGSSMKGV